ncbi:MAG: class D sortase [Bryobacteraceae bacterium]
MRKTIRALSSFVLLTGLALLIAGLDIIVRAWHGQNEAARKWTRGKVVVEDKGFRLGDTIGRLTIPRLNAGMFVIEGDGESQLSSGPGHLADTPLPGNRGNTVIAGHRDTHFRLLKDLQPGDEVLIESRGSQFLYRVREMKVVKPDHTEVLQPTEEETLTLITCYPFYYSGHAPKRYIVRADRVYEPQARAASAD